MNIFNFINMIKTIKILNSFIYENKLFNKDEEINILETQLNNNFLQSRLKDKDIIIITNNLEKDLTNKKNKINI